VRPVLYAVLTVALTVYGSDCMATTTPEQAMRCCRSMSCSSHGHHGWDCCRTTSAPSHPIVLTVSGPLVYPSHVAIAAISASLRGSRPDSPACNVAPQCHAPPIPELQSYRPIRI
jgi:hypothetical protein